MLLWVMNMGFAATATEGAATVPASRGAYLLLGTGCWVAPLLAALLVWR